MSLHHHGGFASLTNNTTPQDSNFLAQTSIGTGYDLSNSVFSPDGRNFQVSSTPSPHHHEARAPET